MLRGQSTQSKGGATPDANGKPTRRRVAACYDYRDAQGNLLYQTLRYEPKDFRQRRPHNGGWAWSLGDAPRVLYRLPELLQNRERAAFVVEGEKDVDRLRELGLVATTNAMGAGKWRPEYTEALRDRQVVILPDNDDAGRKHAEAVADSLAGVAAAVKVVALPGLPPKGDVSDWLDVPGNSKEKLLRLVLDAPTAGQDEDGPSETADGPAAVLTRLDTVTPQPVSWLWRGHIPRGAVTLLDGDPGLGKSTIAIDLAARVSRGWAMPPAAGPVEGAEPEGVLLLTAEDDLRCTVRPRLEAAGADMARVHSFDAVRTGDHERPPVLPFDLALVEARVKEEGIALIIVDPFAAFLDSAIDGHRDSDVRRCLHSLKLLAERTGAAILIIRHLNKLIGGPAVYRGGGSIGITAAARSALVVGRDPADAGRHVLASVKCNVGRMPPSLAYHLASVTEDVARIAWGGEVDLSADDILQHPTGKRYQTTAQQAAEPCWKSSRRPAWSPASSTGYCGSAAFRPKASVKGGGGPTSRRCARASARVPSTSFFPPNSRPPRRPAPAPDGAPCSTPGPRAQEKRASMEKTRGKHHARPPGGGQAWRKHRGNAMLADFRRAWEKHGGNGPSLHARRF
jgi:hypothetical protein